MFISYQFRNSFGLAFILKGWKMEWQVTLKLNLPTLTLSMFHLFIFSMMIGGKSWRSFLAGKLNLFGRFVGYSVKCTNIIWFVRYKFFDPIVHNLNGQIDSK